MDLRLFYIMPNIHHTITSQIFRRKFEESLTSRPHMSAFGVVISKDVRVSNDPFVM